MAFQLRHDNEMAGWRMIYQPDDGYSSQAATHIKDYGTLYNIARNEEFILTGYYYASPTDGYIWAQTTSGLLIMIDFYDDRWLHTWSRTPNYTSVPVHTETEAQRLVRKICQNNIQIVQNNLVCARYAKVFTEEQKSMIRELQDRAEMRKNALIDDGLCNGIQLSYPKGYADLEGYLDALMKGEAIGIATWVVVVIAATVIAGLGTAAYFAYKSFADESEKDVKFSKELMAVLAEKLTPEEYQQLLDETKGIVTKARIKQAASSYGNVLWIVGIAAVTLLAFRAIKNRLA